MIKTRWLIGVFSGIDKHARRAACLETWFGQMMREPPTECYPVWLMGNPQLTEPKLEGHTLWLPCRDEYKWLPAKTKYFCQWAAQNVEFEHLLKCDDDTYVAWDRLKKFIPPGPFVGRNVRNYPNGGAGYILNKAAAKVAGEVMPNAEGAEDLLIGQLLPKAGFSLTESSRFGHSHMDIESPIPTNNMITGHEWRDGDGDMRQAHRRLYGSAEAKPKLFEFNSEDGNEIFGWSRGAFGTSQLAGSSHIRGEQQAQIETLMATRYADIKIRITAPCYVSPCVAYYCDRTIYEPMTCAINGQTVGQFKEYGQQGVTQIFSPGETTLTLSSRPASLAIPIDVVWRFCPATLWNVSW